MRTLAVNSIILSFGGLVSQAFSAFAFLLTARRLAPSEFGPILGALGVAVLLMGMLDFGINSLTIRTLARAPGDVTAFSTTLATKLLMGGGLGLGWVAATGLIAAWRPEFRSFIPLGVYIGLSDATSTLLVPARSMERMVPISIASMLQNGVTLALVAVWSLTSVARLYALPISLVLGALASTILAYAILDDERRVLSRPTWANLRLLWSQSLSFGFVGLASQVQRADVAIVNLVAGSAAGGMFGAPARMTNLLGVAPLALSGALFPRVARAKHQMGARREAVTACTLLVAALSVVYAVIFVFAQPAVHLVLGGEYDGSASVLRVYLVGMLMASANGPLSAVLQAEGQERYIAFTVGAASVIGLIGVAIGASVDGATGAAFGFVALQGVIFAMIVRQLWRTSNEHMLGSIRLQETARADS